MSREIKFRVWDTHKKEWVKNLTYCIDDFSTTNKEWHKVTQFTGMHDKNGKDIYEGDLVLIENTHEKFKDYPLLITFEDGSFCLRLINTNTFSSAITMRDNIANSRHFEGVDPIITIIGNLHENPELLKTE